MLLDDRPPAVLVGPVRRALVHHTGRVVRERPVHDVGVPRHPAAVGGTPEDVIVVDVEDHAVGRGDLGHVPTGRVDDPLGLPGRAARVEEVEQILGLHVLRLAGGRLLGDQLVVPVVATFGERVLVPASSHGDHVLDRRALPYRIVRVRLERDDLATPPGAVGGDQHLGLGIVDPVPQGFGAEAAEHDRMGSADPGAREHRDGELGDHPEVDVDPVALADAQRAECVREAAHLLQELGVRDRQRVPRLALPQERDLVAAARLDVTVEAVDGGVQVSTLEPSDPRRVPLHHGIPGSGPGELAGLFGPEGLVIGPGGLVDGRVTNDGAVSERLRWWE